MTNKERQPHIQKDVKQAKIDELEGKLAAAEAKLIEVEQERDEIQSNFLSLAKTFDELAATCITCITKASDPPAQSVADLADKVRGFFGFLRRE